MWILAQSLKIDFTFLNDPKGVSSRNLSIGPGLAKIGKVELPRLSTCMHNMHVCLSRRTYKSKANRTSKKMCLKPYSLRLLLRGMSPQAVPASRSTTQRAVPSPVLIPLARTV